MTRTTRSKQAGMIAACAVALTTAAFAAGAAGSASAAVEPGTPGRDVHFGLDNDDAGNPFLQPDGVVAPQHMADADLLFGRENDDLLFGRRGNDTLIGGPGSDILVGGPDRGSGPATRTSAPGSDMLVGDEGNDVAIWSPGDGNDVYAGQEGVDAFVVGPLVVNADGSPRVDTVRTRQVPRVDIDGFATYACTLVPVPVSENLGVQYLLRFSVEGTTLATTRLKDVERVYCPGPEAGTVRVADLTTTHPTFGTVRVSTVGGLVGAVIGPLR